MRWRSIHRPRTRPGPLAGRRSGLGTRDVAAAIQEFIGNNELYNNDVMDFLLILGIAGLGLWLLKLRNRLRGVEEELSNVRVSSASAPQLAELTRRVWL